MSREVQVRMMKDGFMEAYLYVGRKEFIID